MAAAPERAFVARRVAVKLEPVCFYLEYQDGASKTRVRAVRSSFCRLPREHPTRPLRGQTAPMPLLPVRVTSCAEGQLPALPGARQEDR